MEMKKEKKRKTLFFLNSSRIFTDEMTDLATYLFATRKLRVQAALKKDVIEG